MSEALQNHLIAGHTPEFFFTNLVKLLPERKKTKIKAVKVYQVYWSWEEWVRFRSSVNPLNYNIDYRESSFKPLSEKLLVEVPVDAF